MLAEREAEGEVIERPNAEFNIEVAKLLIFSRKTRSITEFIIVYKLFLRIKMRRVAVEKQIQ